MPMCRIVCRCCVALAVMSLATFVPSAHAQDPAPSTSSSRSEVADVQDDNTAMREELLRLEGQQKTLLEQVLRLQRQLDGGTATDGTLAAKPMALPAATNPASTSVQPEY